MTDAYPTPLDLLLTLGEDAARAPEWPDYLELGVGSEHVPLLIRMVTDPHLLHEADEPALWAPLHAWRALGQLRAVEAAEPLTTVFHTLEEWEWVNEELPEVFAMLGPGAVPALVRYLDQAVGGEYAGIGAASALREIADEHPETRDAIVAVLVDRLSRFATQHPGLNGFLIAYLIDFQVVESAPLMQQALEGGHVDDLIVGDWEDVQVALGLLPERQTSRPSRFPGLGILNALASPDYPYQDEPFPDEPFPEPRPYSPATPPPSPEHRRERQRTEKRRRKTAKKSKRRNRRK